MNPSGRRVIAAVCLLAAAGAGCRSRRAAATVDSVAAAATPSSSSATAPRAAAGDTASRADAGAPAGKRVAPPDVPPVDVAGVRIEVLPWGKERGLGQNGGYIAAHDPASGRELWTLKVYDVVYQPKLEEDVQDVFISQMSKAGGDTLAITDEKGRHYLVDVAHRTVTRR